MSLNYRAANLPTAFPGATCSLRWGASDYWRGLRSSKAHSLHLASESQTEFHVLQAWPESQTNFHLNHPLGNLLPHPHHWPGPSNRRQLSTNGVCPSVAIFQHMAASLDWPRKVHFQLPHHICKKCSFLCNSGPHFSYREAQLDPLAGVSG